METGSNTGSIESGEEIYGRYLEGDNTAFSDLIAMYEDELARFIYGIVNDYHDTKQLTSETFAQLVINKKKFKGKSAFKTYLFAIAKNLSAQHIKTRIRDRHISLEEAAETLICGESAPQNVLEHEENKRLLREAIKGLKHEYRMILTLLYFDELSNDEASLAMGKSKRQITQLSYDAKIALKKKLEGGNINN